MPEPGTIAQVAVLITAVLGGIAGIMSSIAQRRERAETTEDRRDAAERAARDAIASERATITAEYRGLFEMVKNEAVRDREGYDKEMASMRTRIEAAVASGIETARERDECRRELNEVRNRLHIVEARILEMGG
jgi:hypothetical protein